MGAPPGIESNSIPLRTDATEIGEWETFNLIPQGDNRYGIRTANGCYLTAVDGGGKGAPPWLPRNSTFALHADRTHVEAWEQCQLIFMVHNNSAFALENQTTGAIRNLVESGQWNQYYQTLSNFDFLQTQIQQVGIRAAIAYVQWLNPTEAANFYERNPTLEVALKHIQIALQLSSDDLNLLAPQLWGRLQQFIYLLTIEALLEQAYRQWPKPWLCPLFPSFEPTGYG